MKSRIAMLWIAALASLWADARLALAQEDVADVPSSHRRIGADAHKRYVLLGRKNDQPAPEAGYGLLIIFPGGDGGDGFEPFVKRIFKFAVPEGYLVAQPIAPQWGKGQEFTWPVKKGQVPKAKFLTQEFVAEIIEDIAKKDKLDPARQFVLGWSSGGPAAYAVSLADERIVGAFAAMSVFKPDQLPPLGAAKDKAFYIYHSPDDRMCPLSMAESAERDLKVEGATTTLAKYPGGQGWHGDMYGDIGAGIRWLEANSRGGKK